MASSELMSGEITFSSNTGENLLNFRRNRFTTKNNEFRHKNIKKFDHISRKLSENINDVDIDSLNILLENIIEKLTNLMTKNVKQDECRFEVMESLRKEYPPQFQFNKNESLAYLLLYRFEDYLDDRAWNRPEIEKAISKIFGARRHVVYDCKDIILESGLNVYEKNQRLELYKILIKKFQPVPPIVFGPKLDYETLVETFLRIKYILSFYCDYSDFDLNKLTLEKLLATENNSLSEDLKELIKLWLNNYVNYSVLMKCNDKLLEFLELVQDVSKFKMKDRNHNFNEKISSNKNINDLCNSNRNNSLEKCGKENVHQVKDLCNVQNCPNLSLDNKNNDLFYPKNGFNVYNNQETKRNFLNESQSKIIYEKNNLNILSNQNPEMMNIILQMNEMNMNNITTMNNNIKSTIKSILDNTSSKNVSLSKLDVTLGCRQTMLETLRREPPELYRFDGSHTLAEVLLKSFEEYIADREWNASEIKKALLKVFKEKPNAVQKSKTIIENNKFNLLEIKNRLKCYRLLVKQFQPEYMYEINHERQTLKENIYDVFLRIKKSYKFWRGDNISEKEIVSYALTTILSKSLNLSSKEQRNAIHRAILSERRRYGSELQIDHSKIEDIIEKIGEDFDLMKRLEAKENKVINNTEKHQDIYKTNIENWKIYDKNSKNRVNYGENKVLTQTNFPKVCFICREPGHIKRHCNVRCIHCNKTGHFKDNCYHKLG